MSRIWALTSFRAGETTQVTALAERLGEPWERVSVEYKPWASALGLMRAVTLTGLSNPETLKHRQWPELLITASLRNEPVARWVRRESGGRTKIIYIGRCWARIADFDLVIATPQYQLPAQEGLLENPLTIHSVTAEKLEAAKKPPNGSPATGVFLGGNSGPMVFDDENAQDFARKLEALRHRFGGALWVSTSARTPQLLADAVQRVLSVEDRFYRWQPNDPDNPLMHMLAGCERLIVTGDSIAMLSDCVAAGKPTYIYDIPADRYAGLNAAIYRAAMRWAPKRWWRDVRLVHQAAYAADWARPLEDLDDNWQPQPPDYIEPTVRVVQSLLR